MALESLAAASILRPTPAKHTDFFAYHTFIGPWLHRQSGVKFDTVALMREPLDWLRSWYRFKLRDELDQPGIGPGQPDFVDFARKFSATGDPAYRGICSQSQFLTCDDQRVDRIYKYEEIGTFVQFLEDRMDCHIELPRVNVPPAVATDLTPAQEEDLRQLLRRDMDLYHSL
ncbi:hypothetical protein PAF17_00680 [Paracoccus sp. Z330]|uniref:Sulfotransferase family protein n=1 Tax=Paracoccus onchidii TaxID=3017813 RepID=A0ABT4Z9K2_9RHOB|nr:hypothetical protein [Paracoccus onchidii]MDB6176019.1 hypothetical protein [Paracoccus onchidii]